MAADAAAQKITLRRYSVADGLAHDTVRVIRQDSKGYLWIGTGEGISRFDGYRFVNYSSNEGLTVPLVNDIVEDRHGRIWIATNGAGLARFMDDPAGTISRTYFATYRVVENGPANQINRLVVDGDVLWCATDDGLYRAQIPADGSPVFERMSSSAGAFELFRTADGRLWLDDFDRGIVARDGQGTAEFGRPGESSSVVGFAEQGGQLIVATTDGLYRLATRPGSRSSWSRLRLPTGAPTKLSSVFVDSSGTLWLGAGNHLIEMRDGRERAIGRAAGLPEVRIEAFFEDRSHNLWIGTAFHGLFRISSRRLVNFSIEDGLPESEVVAVTEGPGGVIYAATRSRGWFAMVGDKPVVAARSSLPPFNEVGKRLVCDGRSVCWTLTPDGLFTFDAMTATANRLLLRRPGTAEFVSYSGRAPNGLYRQKSGFLWFGTNEPALYRVTVGDDTAATVHRIQLDAKNAVAPLAEDRSGTLWVADMVSIGRLRAGHIEVVQPDDRFTTDPRSGLVDSRGWLWVGSRYRGVFVSRDPEPLRPQWIRYSTENGLSSNSIWAMTEDAQGRIYLATNRGLDRLDPRSGQVQHLGSADGLGSDLVSDCLVDTRGHLWLATSGGLSRVDLQEAERPDDPAPTYITRVEVGDAQVPLAESGVTALSGIEVAPGANRVVIQFVGLAIGAERGLRYQYQLVGVDSGWSQPAGDRTVTYAGLGAGRYRWHVRAVDARDIASTTPAVFEFTVLPPVWRQWWFLTLVLALATGSSAIVLGQRARRRRADEAFRRQVATDLHDDVGAGLSQIAILSEVLQRQSPQPAGGLTDIARLARTLRESMNDIVWAVGPSSDRLSDLVDRMRQVAFTLLDFEGLRVEFDAPSNDALNRVHLPMVRRRHLLLIYKEAITNVGRHARASQLMVRITVEARGIELLIQDDGCGFVVDEVKRGHGLDSLAGRAKALNAELIVTSEPGRGTRIRASIPLRPA